MPNRSTKLLTVTAYDIIKQLITNNQLSYNQKLIYRDLEEQLNMSKTPILAALTLLAEEGFVRYKKNFGFYVNSIEDKKCVSAYSGRMPLKNEYYWFGGRKNINLQSTQSLQGKAYQNIKSQILKMKLTPGRKLIFSELEAMLGISKTPIITALAQLESEGYVTQKRNIGYYVRDIDLKESLDLFETRKAIELANADFVINNHDFNDLTILKSITNEIKNYTSLVFDGKSDELNRKLHLHIARMGHNSFMIKYIEQIYDLIDFKRKISQAYLLPPRGVEALRSEHIQIAEAIFDKNIKVLKQTLTKHFKTPIKDLKKYINSLGNQIIENKKKQ